jgi:hypothetical protein
MILSEVTWPFALIYVIRVIPLVDLLLCGMNCSAHGSAPVHSTRGVPCSLNTSVLSARSGNECGSFSRARGTSPGSVL